MSAITAWMGCTARRVGKGEVMLKKVIIRCDDPNIDKDEIYGYLKQKPNRKLLGFNNPHLLKRGKLGYSVFNKHFLSSGAGYPFYLAIHNLVNPKREAKRKARHDASFEKRKQDYLENQKTKRGREKRLPKRHRTVGEFLYDIGEPPVILDTAKTARSLHQVTEYLYNKGYFDGTVRDTILYPPFQNLRKNPKKAIQGFIVIPGQPYTINTIEWRIEDPGVAYDLQNDTARKFCLIKTGDVYDLDNFEKEQDRLTRSLRNNGYYKFSKDYISFKADSSLGKHQVNIRIFIKRSEYQVNDSTWVETNHQRYEIRNIYVKSLVDLSQLRDEKDLASYDTTYFQDITFLRNMDLRNGLPVEELLRFKPEVLSSRIAFERGHLYRQVDYEATYRQLTNLRVFRQVVIDPKEVEGDKLDITIKLIPVSKQSFTTQVEGTTNSGTSLGIGGSYSYENTNVARGAEILKFGVKGGTEVQQTLNGTQTGTGGFNTIQAGLEASLNIPREFFPFNYLVSKNKPVNQRITEDRRTIFLSSFNYQHRVDYDRSLVNLSYGYTFRIRKLATPQQAERDYGRIALFPIELNVVKVLPRQGLIDLLQNPDPLLHYRFTDHLIRDFRITYVLNTQESKNKKHRSVFFLKVDAESSGLLLRPLFDAFNAEKNGDGSYEIAGIPFSHYLRFFVDGRYNQPIGNHQNVVMRAAIGVGFPLANFPTLPLEKSFYAGGANGIRAWEARTLGPGSYIVPSDQKYAQFGDVQLEYNLEYRFKLTKSLNGAVFFDGGNIWLLEEDSARPGADFSFKDLRFFQDLAAGPGVGIRYDLSFFIVRLDLGFKLRDPSYPYGERWYVPGQRRLGSNLNFGIGYPF